MRLYLYATTNVPDLSIDFIEIKLKSGEIAVLDWSDSETKCEGSEVNAWYRGVCIDNADAQGRLKELEDMEIVHVELYSESGRIPEIKILNMNFSDDNGDSLEFESDILYSSKDGDSNG